MSKTVPKSKFAEWKGLDRLSSAVHEMGCIYRELSKDDFGIDGEIELVTPKANGQGLETTGSIIKVQAKSGVSYVREDTPESFSTPVKLDDLMLWNNSNFPVLFVVYHPKDDVLYAKEIKKYIKETRDVFTPPYHIVYNKKEDVFSHGYYEKICEHSSVSIPRVSFSSQERLYSNLFEVIKLPKVYIAETKLNDLDQLRQAVPGFMPPSTIFEKKLYTLSDLYKPRSSLWPYVQVPITKMSGCDILKDKLLRNHYIFLLNTLLGLHRKACGIAYNRHFRRNYFPRQNSDEKCFKVDWTSIRTGKKAPERITAKYYNYGRYEFWRHLAAKLSFIQFNDAMFLQILPEYLFTNEGVTPCDSEFVGPYTTKKKAVEHNQSVLNHVLFWADKLSRGKDKIYLMLHNQAIMILKKEPLIGIAPFAIPEDPAVFEERSSGLQLNLFLEQEGDDEIDDEY